MFLQIKVRHYLSNAYFWYCRWTFKQNKNVKALSATLELLHKKKIIKTRSKRQTRDEITALRKEIRERLIDFVHNGEQGF